MNELQKESSIYLQQHANNPIYWKAWSKTLLENNDKLLVISIGYTACHWCHVMEHETFEDEEVGVLMNNHFTSIKVDREEHPDVDTFYMKAVQLMTKAGGWPLNVVCLPNGMPIWGGTYFRKEEWVNALNQLRLVYKENPEKVLEYAQQLKKGIETISLIPTVEKKESFTKYDELVINWTKSFDHEYGGYQRTPKFMMPTNLDFLNAHAHYFNSEIIKEHVDKTLTKMAWGGLFDCVGGGFSRYSVDQKWHIPHFEKMLYDNAQLLSTYSNAYLKTNNPFYKSVIEEILFSIENDFKNGENGYFASLDADSLNENGQSEEGAFYSWKKEELQSVLKDDFELFSKVYNINSFGYWEEFEKYVLIQNNSLENIARDFKMPVGKLNTLILKWKKLLLDYRNKREAPICDTKCITSWNGLLLKGFCDAYDATQDPTILEKAKNLANYLQNKACEDGKLKHIYAAESFKIKGYLEDYAHVIEGFIALYKTTFETKYLLFANALMTYSITHFYDEKSGFFAQNELNEATAFTTHFETEDNVIPASNSVMAHSLYYLSIAFENASYDDMVSKMLEAILPQIDFGSAYSNWLLLWLLKEKSNRQLAIVGENALQLKAEIMPKLDSTVLIFGSTTNTTIPYLLHKFDNSKSMLYLCEQSNCFEPKATTNEILNSITL